MSSQGGGGPAGTSRSARGGATETGTCLKVSEPETNWIRMFGSNFCCRMDPNFRTVNQDCLEQVMQQAVAKMETSELGVVLGVGKIACKLGTVGKSIDAIVDLASTAKLLKSEEVVSSAGKVVAQEGGALRSIPRLASDVPDVGQAAVKGSLAASQTVRAGLIAVNALFLGMDIFFICKDSISLAKGSESEVSQFIRARADPNPIRPCISKICPN